MLAKVRCSESPFLAGDRVFYKREESGPWRGPAKVLMQEGQEVIMKDCGKIVTSHAFRVTRASGDSMASAENNQETERGEKGPVTKEHMESPYQPHWENSPETLVPDEAACETEFGQSESVVPENHTAIECNWHSADMKPAKGSNVCFKLKTDDGDTEYEAKVLGPAGKSTGKNRDWLNVAFQSPDWTQRQQRSLNWTGDVKNWKYCDSGNVEEVNFVDEALYQKAKEDEITNWIENEVFSEVEDTGQSVITTRWVFSEKPDGSKKARLVARGFQEDQSDLILESPTSSRESQRFALILMASYGFEIRSLDVKTAFLQGKKLERDVFLRPPADICAGKLWKLSKCVYGLADAARNWFDKVADFFSYTRY